MQRKILIVLLIILTISMSACVRTIGDQSKIASRTTFKAPLPNTANAAVDEIKHTITLPLRNELGESIKIHSVRGSGYGDCKKVLKIQVRLENGENILTGENAQSIPQGNDFSVIITCNNFNNKTTGEKVETELNIHYIPASTRTIQSHKGKVEANI